MPITNNPPPLKSTPKSGTPKAPKENPTTAKRAEALNGFGQLAQLPLMATKQFADAGALSAHWPGIASEVAKLAETDEKIAGLVDPLITVGPYTGLIAAVLPFALQIMVNHGIARPGMGGTVPASLLSAQVETALAQQEAEALRAQAAAEQEARRIRDEMKAARAAYERASSDAKNDMASARTEVVPYT